MGRMSNAGFEPHRAGWPGDGPWVPHVIEWGNGGGVSPCGCAAGRDHPPAETVFGVEVARG